MEELLKRTEEDFSSIFGDRATHFGLAPGRVEVLGNHTDYNHGFILSAAIDRRIAVCGRRTEGETAKIYSVTFKAGESFSVAAPEKRADNFWANYVKGVVDELHKRKVALGGFEAVLSGDVPLGAGLSSSAALEVAVANFLKQIFPYEMEKIDLALTCQAAENNFVGVGCGILDQFSSAMGKKDHLVFLDCRDLKAYEHIPVGSGVELVLANTNAAHELAEGTYNRLRADCFAAAKHFASRLGGKVTHLRDVSPEDYRKHLDGLAPETARRARHIVTENARVLAGVAALRKGDLATMGRMMKESHASSRDDFGNSCHELDVMAELAGGLEGCYGSRLSGGGFGGCTVNLVEAGRAERFAARLAELYQNKTGIAAQMHVCRAVDGASGGAL